MKINQNKTGFDLLKKESENQKLSDEHISLFEEKLNQKSNQKSKINWFSLPMAAVLVIGLVLSGLLFFNQTDTNQDLIDYRTTKSYFASYVEFEIDKQKDKITVQNKQIIESSLSEVSRLQEDYLKIEQKFFSNHYDKQILKRMIDNFRQQLDILENIDRILNDSLSKQPKTNQNENNTI